MSTRWQPGVALLALLIPPRTVDEFYGILQKGIISFVRLRNLSTVKQRQSQIGSQLKDAKTWVSKWVLSLYSARTLILPKSPGTYAQWAIEQPRLA